MEYTSIRNIINRFAEQNDGYLVLYSMLELVHPALQKDAIIQAPRSSECDDDIHLYAQKFDGWMRYESYANRPYSPREQVNLFIKELSSHYAPAISRIRRLMDAWQPFDMNIPEPLRMSVLPNTIERFMMEEMGTTPQIRRIKDRCHHDGKQRTNKDKNKETSTDDKICSFCGTHGHVATECGFMAKLLTATEALTKVDNKSKTKLQEAYKQAQLKKRSRRLKRHAGAIRKMIDTGASASEIQVMLDQIPDIADQDEVGTPSDDESHVDTSEANDE